MTRTIATMPVNYTYDPNHNRSHYLIEGIEGYKNGGEFAEIICKAIRTTREYYYEQYFKRVHSTNVDYVIVIDDMVYIYNMDMHTEFKEFVDTFSYWDNHSKKIRITTTLKMIKWLEERVA